MLYALTTIVALVARVHAQGTPAPVHTVYTGPCGHAFAHIEANHESKGEDACNLLREMMPFSCYWDGTYCQTYEVCGSLGASSCTATSYCELRQMNGHEVNGPEEECVEQPWFYAVNGVVPESVCFNVYNQDSDRDSDRTKCEADDNCLWSTDVKVCLPDVIYPNGTPAPKPEAGEKIAVNILSGVSPVCKDNICRGIGACAILHETGPKQGQFERCEINPERYTTADICEGDYGVFCQEREVNGVEACEDRGFEFEEQCVAVGCCKWEGGQCLSNVDAVDGVSCFEDLRCDNDIECERFDWSNNPCRTAECGGDNLCTLTHTYCTGEQPMCYDNEHGRVTWALPHPYKCANDDGSCAWLECGKNKCYNPKQVNCHDFHNDEAGCQEHAEYCWSMTQKMKKGGTRHRCKFNFTQEDQCEDHSIKKQIHCRVQKKNNSCIPWAEGKVEYTEENGGKCRGYGEKKCVTRHDCEWHYEAAACRERWNGPPRGYSECKEKWNKQKCNRNHGCAYNTRNNLCEDA